MNVIALIGRLQSSHLTGIGYLVRSLAAIAVLLAASAAQAAELELPALVVEDAEGDTRYSVSIQILILMTILTLLPSIVIMMTSFTRIIVVLAILRQGLGLQQTPSNQVMIGLALFLSLFVMQPVISEIQTDAVEPYLAEELPADKALMQAAMPLRGFMLSQTRESDLEMFYKVSGRPLPQTTENVDFFVLVPAFVTSELKTAFQIGFLFFLPFLVIDIVVASVLMSMGMMMLSPLIISLPFKLMLFVLVDGWVMVVGTLASSFA